MSTGEAIETLVKAGWLTEETADKIVKKAAEKDKRKENLKKTREVASRALVDYLCILCDATPREEHTRFVTMLFQSLEDELKEIPEDPIKAFLKSKGW